MTKQEKAKIVKELLNQIEDMVCDHLNSCDDHGIDIPAVELIKSAIEMYENFADGSNDKE